LHFDTDSANLGFRFPNTHHQPRYQLPELGGNRGVISQKNKRSGPEHLDPGCLGERTRGGFNQYAFYFGEAARLSGQRPEPSCGDEVADLVRGHEDVWRETMNIILVSGRLAKARSITLSWRQAALLAGGFAAAVVSLAAGLYYVTLRLAADHDVPYLRSLLVSVQAERHERTDSYLRENLNAMAVKLGEMQAQLMRLDTLGERLAKVAGFKPQDLLFGEVPGRGGALAAAPQYDLSLGELTRQLEWLTRQLDDRGDKLGILESSLTLDSARKKLVPTMLPVQGGWYSSNYGWRIDPFTGQRAFHEGIDVIAGEGTPVVAAAGGVVVYADFHPQYGNMIEIDHGNDLVSRYAHASKRLVKVGDLVLRGAPIAEVGRTGRATGTHLHFEVRQRGAPVNPAQFLRLPG